MKNKTSNHCKFVVIECLKSVKTVLIECTCCFKITKVVCCCDINQHKTFHESENVETAGTVKKL